MVDDNEIDFPRGGASTLTPLEVRKIRTTAEKDILFEKKVSSCCYPYKLINVPTNLKKCWCRML